MTCERPARLDDTAIDEIQELEERLGVILVAYEKVPPFKKLTDAELARIRAMERETGAILVAYEA
ncbi:MAG TPA: hypothetical protein PK089_09890 [Methanoregulaceae archaeon]|nr:hypothetical protein [Methanoregulaceae archaeon]HOV67505.1 hypothetical protein [Methanoregulaceae archaeon]HQJ88345.1 hypothetical protein [Methanoregulaceae archaeon]